MNLKHIKFHIKDCRYTDTLSFWKFFGCVFIGKTLCWCKVWSWVHSPLETNPFHAQQCLAVVLLWNQSVYLCLAVLQFYELMHCPNFISKDFQGVFFKWVFQEYYFEIIPSIYYKIIIFSVMFFKTAREHLPYQFYFSSAVMVKFQDFIFKDFQGVFLKCIF